MVELVRLRSGAKRAGLWLAGCLVLAFVAVAALMPTRAVEAADEEKQDTVIQMSPLKDRQELEPGQKYQGSFDIYNRGAKSFDFRVYVKPFSIGSDCTDNYEVPSDYTEMTKWVTFDQLNYYDLQPEQKQTVNFTVDVPKNAPSGGQYVVIFAETGDFDAQSGATINVSKRIGYKFYADLGGTDVESGEVESVKQDGWFWEPPIHSSSQIRNTGNVDFAGTHTYTVLDLSGKEIYSQASKEDVLPETCREIKQQWDKTPAFGIFWVENKIDFLGDTQYSKRRLVIVMPIYIVVIFTLVIVLLIWALVLRIRGGGNKRKSAKKGHGEEL